MANWLEWLECIVCICTGDNRKRRGGICSLIIAIIIIVVVVVTTTRGGSDNRRVKSLKSIGIGGGGAFFNPMIDPNDNNRIYVTSDMGGLYYSINGGSSWERSTERGVFRSAHITKNGTVFVGGYGLYASFNSGKKLNLIYPKDVKARVSRYGWNENLMMAPNYNNGYVKAVTSLDRLIYFVTIDWYSNFLLMESSYFGNNLKTLINITLPTTHSDPTSVDVFIVANTTGVYFTLEEEIIFYNFETKSNTTVFSSNGHIKDFKKIGSNFYVIEDIESESQIMCTKNFLQKTYVHDMNELTTTFTKNGVTGTFTWNYTKLHGVREDNIFILSHNNIVGSESSTIDGVLKFDGSNFEWVFDEVFNTKGNANLKGWSYGSYGPFYGVYAFSRIPDKCLVANIETVYSIHYISQTKREMKNLHSNYHSNTKTYNSTGLDVQTTYWVREDPFDSNHVLIATTDMGLQISTDGSKTWKRMNMTGTDLSIYNTCYDIYFNQTSRNIVYGLWSSIHDAPYTPMSSYKDYTKGRFAISYNGGITWDFTYSSGIPEDSIPIKMSVQENIMSTIIAVATFNRGFYISRNSGKTFTNINEGMEYIHGLIFGEDVLIVNDDIYCLTAPFYENDKWLPSKLYKYTMSTQTLQTIKIDPYILLRSISYHPAYGLLLNSIPTNEYKYYEQYQDGIQINKNGGVYGYKGDRIFEVMQNPDGIFNSVVVNNRTFAVDTYGKVLEYSFSQKELLIELNFKMLKNICVSNDKNFLYVTTFGGGTYKIGI